MTSITQNGKETMVAPATATKKSEFGNKSQVLESILTSDSSLTITEIIQNVLSGYIPISIHLTETERKCMELLLENQPSVILDIQFKVMSIVHDNKIDAADIPIIIQLVKQLYMLCYDDNKQSIRELLKSEKQNLPETVGRLTKCIIRVVLLKQNKTNTRQNTDEWQNEQDRAEKLLSILDIFIDTSIELILVSKQVKINRSSFCCNWTKSKKI